jgi:hypothetical protein
MENGIKAEHDATLYGEGKVAMTTPEKQTISHQLTVGQW